MGIPDHFRAEIWQLCTGAYDSPVKNEYQKYLLDVSPFERAINRDISRTYPKHEFFKDKVCRQAIFFFYLSFCVILYAWAIYVVKNRFLSCDFCNALLLN